MWNMRVKNMKNGCQIKRYEIVRKIAGITEKYGEIWVSSFI